MATVGYTGIYLYKQAKVKYQVYKYPLYCMYHKTSLRKTLFFSFHRKQSSFAYIYIHISLDKYYLKAFQALSPFVQTLLLLDFQHYIGLQC